MLGNLGPENRSDKLKSHGDGVGSRMGLGPQAAASPHCSVLSFALPAGRRRPVCAAKTQANTFFPSVLTK